MTFTVNSNIPRIGVGAIIMKDGKILLGKRKGLRSSGCYGLPGGFLENNETLEDCARREVVEETGLKLLTFYPLFIINGISDNIHYVDMIFLTHCNSQEPRIVEKDRVEIWEWFDLNNLPTPLYEPTSKTMEYFVSNYFFIKFALLVQKLIPSRNFRIFYFNSL